MSKYFLNTDNGGTYQLSPGDQLVETIFATGLAKHFAVYLGYLSDGREWIAENHHLAGGVRLIAAEAYFASNRAIVRVEPFNGNELQRRLAVERALKLTGKDYDLISYNCEHFAAEVTTGVPESKQVGKIVGGLIVLGIIGLLANSSK